MSGVFSIKTKSANVWLWLALALLACLAAPARADRKNEARDQFERAVRLRTILEGAPQRDRKISDYKQVITSFHRVYLITPRSAEVPAALNQAAILYRAMGDLFDTKYYRTAIDS